MNRTFPEHMLFTLLDGLRQKQVDDLRGNKRAELLAVYSTSLPRSGMLETMAVLAADVRRHTAKLAEQQDRYNKVMAMLKRYDQGYSFHPNELVDIMIPPRSAPGVTIPSQFFELAQERPQAWCGPGCTCFPDPNQKVRPEGFVHPVPTWDDLVERNKLPAAEGVAEFVKVKKASGFIKGVIERIKGKGVSFTKTS